MKSSLISFYWFPKYHHGVWLFPKLRRPSANENLFNAFVCVKVFEIALQEHGWSVNLKEGQRVKDRVEELPTIHLAIIPFELQHMEL